MGKDIRVYSDKAYRKNKGQIFEAVGNVIIISGAHTIYGEAATLDIGTKNINIEGNVRYNTQGLTIYGSKLDFNASKNEFNVENARIITEDFNVIAKKIKKVSATEYFTEEAEFTTCRDCKESWTIYGKKIHLTINDYVRISHAEVRVKGINVLYVPYLVLPVKSNRESGLLFPRFYQRRQEGVAFEQPYFWAIDQDKDLTVTPILLGERGYGANFEYRHEISDRSWVDLKTRFIEDKMYLPLINNDSKSGQTYSRFFTELETHISPNENINSHFRFQVLQDLDYLADFFDYVDQRFEGSAAKTQGFLEYRFKYATFSTEFDVGRNFFFAIPDKTDKEYVQLVPELSVLTKTMNIYQSDSNLFKSISWSTDINYAIFKQSEPDESVYLRNAKRFDFKPNLNWQIFTAGPFDLSTNYSFDFQNYQFPEDGNSSFSKRADVIRTELSFSVEKIFGSSYKNTYSNDQIIPKTTKNDPKEIVNEQYIGQLPGFKKSFVADQIIEIRNSYRHGQDFKLIHHLITGEHESGNRKFKNQILNSRGWFDYRDSIRSAQSELGTNETRTLIPLKNTMELQWNNSLIKKTPTSSYSLKDGKYLKDNFSYTKIGHLNISQGLILGDNDDESLEFNDRLTRLYIDTGISLDRWSFDLDEYFFHQESDHIFNFDITRRFDYLSALFGYNYNSLNNSEVLKTAKLGLGIMPFNTLGLTYIQEFNIEDNIDIRKRIGVDIMPNNNCWVFSLGFEEGTYGKLYSFNFLFNFAGDNYQNFHTNYLDVARLR